MAWSWYTKGRRIPTLIGKDVSGRRIPGGPYTGLQAVTAAGVPAVLWWTRELWAADMAGLAMFAVLIGATVAGVKLVGKVDFASRNPVLLLGGYLRQTGRPISGTLAGRKLAEPRTHRLTGGVDVTYSRLDDRDTALKATEPAPPATSARTPNQPAPAATAAEPLTAEPESYPPSAVAVATPHTEAPSRTRTSRRAGERTGSGTAALHPAAPPAPDRRRTGLEAFLSAAAAARPPHTEEDAA